jgi:poly-gamma-glutamate system protein
LSWRLDSRRRFILLGLAVTALLLQALLDYTRAPVKQRDFDLKLEAANRADAAFSAIRETRGLADGVIDLINDPAGTGLIGPEFSQITNARGDLDAKLTSLNPNFAGLMVSYFRQAGLSPGDPVAVAVSGSFPGMNICLYAAMEAMDLRPVVITSVGSSMWGANNPDFTWLDMESIFYENGIFSTRSQAATFGGGNDMGRGLSPSGRAMIAKAIERNNVPLLPSGNIEESITQRMTFYEEAVRGRAFKLYVNVGGGVASIGSSHNKILLPIGLNFDLGAHNWPRKGSLILFADKGVPTLHLLQIAEIARNNGLPVAPDYLPQPGEGEIFQRDMYNFPLAAGILFFYCLACILILAPELRNGLFDKLGRSPKTVVVVLLLSLAVIGTPAKAATSWQEVKGNKNGMDQCLNIDGTEFSYGVFQATDEAVYHVTGPRRIKLITRYVFASDDSSTVVYNVAIARDDKEEIRRNFTVTANKKAAVCSSQERVSGIKRLFIDLPRGKHKIAITVSTSGQGQIVGRLFQEKKIRKATTVPYAPDSFIEMATLQFESGAHSTYYRFDSVEPLIFTVAGPTNLRVFTRLDFDMTMSGSQDYALAVYRDGVLWNNFHFNAKKLGTARYMERADLLPGSRKTLKIPVPSGSHQYEIRCIRPDACGLTAQIRIPKSDLGGRK